MGLGMYFGAGGKKPEKIMRISGAGTFKKRVDEDYFRRKIGAEITSADYKKKKTSELRDEIAGMIRKAGTGGLSESQLRKRLMNSGVRDADRKKIIEALRSKYVVKTAEKHEVNPYSRALDTSALEIKNKRSDKISILSSVFGGSRKADQPAESSASVHVSSAPAVPASASAAPAPTPIAHTPSNPVGQGNNPIPLTPRPAGNANDDNPTNLPLAA